MAVTATLNHTTPYRLLYLLNQDGGAGTTLTITNAVLLADAIAGLSGAGLAAGAMGPTLVSIINASVLGIGPIAAGTALTQAQARAILNSDDAARAVLTNNNVPRAVTRFTCRDVPDNWSVDVDVTGGLPDIRVVATGGGGARTALLEIMFRHSAQL